MSESRSNSRLGRADALRPVADEGLSIRVRVLELGLEVSNAPAVRGLGYDRRRLIVEYDVGPVVDGEQGRKAAIVFENPRAFRCVDEGVLLGYWTDKTLVDNWFFEVLAGGWFAPSAEVAHYARPREFLICGSDLCVSVLADDPPRVTHLGEDER